MEQVQITCFTLLAIVVVITFIMAHYITKAMMQHTRIMIQNNEINDLKSTVKRLRDERDEWRGMLSIPTVQRVAEDKRFTQERVEELKSYRK